MPSKDKGLLKGYSSRSTFHLFTFKKTIVFQHFASGLRPVRFLEKLSLISLLKSDLKIHVFAFLTLSNIKLTFFFLKKNMVSFFSRY